ncbi:EamA family transporter [Pikeienuella piscinae]|uniref:EamA family transporter n=1 Tax=Pikeienuella piscinae TaxID=2748098 RepID=A0A7L5BTZ0_9RHOB|nr:DMT family transporter [Pikeienuella piscinae]QIE55165.1 EamA family transporter [Pikeienuella piscinae]
MSIGVFFLVLGAALLHAAWNVLVKGGGDKLAAVTAVVIGQGLCGAVALIFAPTPDAAAIPFILFGITLHIGYQFFLMRSYRIGDLTQVYPIARGVAPMLVAGISYFALGAELDRVEVIAIVVIGIGILSLSGARQSDGLRNGLAATLALATGCFIAAYTLVDGYGARVAVSPLGYYGWAAIGNAVVFSALIGVLRPQSLVTAVRSPVPLLIGGAASFAAYAMAIYAFTVAPIALVAALRETSIVFALLIGVIFLKERLNLLKIASTAITLSGAALLRLSKG